MRTTGRTSRSTRALGSGLLIGALALGLTATTVPAGAQVSDTDPTSSATPTPGATADAKATPAFVGTPPYGAAFPVTLETDFSRPYRAISSSANSDFSLLNDLERLIRGSYMKPDGSYRPVAERKANRVYLSISRMENSHRVGRELIRAAKKGVTVRVIHGKASQSKESRSLQRQLNAATYAGKHTGKFKICVKGRSNACLSGLRGAIMHSKILLIGSTYTRTNQPAKGVIWSGSANLGGPSGERTYNNGLTIYNDRKLAEQTLDMWNDMWAERNVRNDYLQYVRAHDGSNRYGYTGATSSGYTRDYASYGMFYSNLSNVTIYATPILATPTNGKDPVLNLLNRVVPDNQCRIRLQENRFKYRRIAVAQKLVKLADAGCKVTAVSFQDDLSINRTKHCQQYIRICRPILDVFKTANQHIDVGWAKPHDKTILIEGVLRPNRLNPEEQLPSGGAWPAAGARVKMVQAGSAALTGSNLVVSDEITTETTDPSVYDDYLEHFKAISISRNFKNYPY